MSELDSKKKEDAESDSGKTVIWVVILIAMMFMFATADWPSGNKTTLTGFILFWFRELAVLGLLLVMLVIKMFSGIKTNSKPKSTNTPVIDKPSDTD